MSKINTACPVVIFIIDELWGDVFDFSVEFSVEDITDYDSLEKCNEFESIEIALERDEVYGEALNAVDLNEKFDEEEDVFVGFVRLTIITETTYPLFIRMEFSSSILSAPGVTSFMNVNFSSKNALNLMVSS